MAGRTKKLQKDKPTKQEYDVAKFLRFNVPTKKASLHGMEVSCFFASAAVDALLDSQWSASKASEPLFVDRNSCVDFCHRLIEKGLFHRARQVKAKKKKGDRDLSKKKAAREAAEKEDGGTGDELRERKRKQEKKEEKEEAKPEGTVADEGEEMKKQEQKMEEKKDEKKDEGKKKKPVKLVMTDDQRFLDGEENIYVWIYDPASTRTLVIGSLIVCGTIAVCLFPLWPEEVHGVVYYCSLVGIAFVGSILGLAVVRFILFCLIWLLTLGRHHVWLFPNLTEDVGFFQSFRPLYMHDKVLRASPSKEEAGEAQSGARGQEAKTKARAGHREDTDSEPEFEMVGRLDLEGDAELRGEGGEDSEENGEEEECGVEDEEYDEDGANEGLEEEEGEKEEREKDGELKKDK